MTYLVSFCGRDVDFELVVVLAAVGEGGSITGVVVD